MNQGGSKVPQVIYIPWYGAIEVATELLATELFPCNAAIVITMDKNNLKRLFPDLEDGLYNDLVEHGTIKEVKAGETLLKVGQTIRSTMLIIDGLVKLYREDDEVKKFFIYHLNAGQGCSLSMVCAAKHETCEILAKALTDETVLAIPLEYMEHWMSKYKSYIVQAGTGVRQSSIQSRINQSVKVFDLGEPIKQFQ